MIDTAINYYIMPGLPKRTKKTPIELLKLNTCNYFNLKIETLESRCRRRIFVEARFFFFYYAYNNQKHTLSALAKSVGRDHTTVIHGIKTIKDLVFTDTSYKDALFNFTSFMNNQ